MNFNKINKTYLIIFFLPLLALLFFYFKNLSEKDKEISSRPVSVNLITSVHPDLSWDFNPINSEVLVKGSVKNIKKMTISEKIKAVEEAKKTPEKKKK